jgi:two-component system LytT family response regulator
MNKNKQSRKKQNHLIDDVPQTPQQQNRVVVKDGSRIRIIAVSDIEFLEAADDYVKIHTAEGTFLKNKTMQFFEQTLASHQFVRVHRSYLLNVQLISKLHPHEKESYLAQLSNGKKVPVSKNGYSKLKTVLGL